MSNYVKQGCRGLWPPLFIGQVRLVRLKYNSQVIISCIDPDNCAELHVEPWDCERDERIDNESTKRREDQSMD